MPSLCTKCFEQGETKFLMTEIPYYKEVIISSFRCGECHHHDVQITNAAELAPKAVTFTLKVDPVMCEMDEVLQDLSRTVVRTDSTRITIPELGFEIPPNRSEINTVEGLLLNIRESLAYQQEQRKLQDPTGYAKIQEICDKFELMQNGEENFTLILHDPAGHCFITNPFAPSTDPRCTVVNKDRTREEYILLGYASEDVAPILTSEEQDRKQYKDKLLTKAIADIRKREAKELRKHGASVMKLGENSEEAEAQKKAEYKAGGSRGLKTMSSKLLNKKDLSNFDSFSQQALDSTCVFPQTCPACRAESKTRMCLVDVPFFGEIIVMCASCFQCGYKDTEIKSSEAYADKAIRITVKCDSPDDLSRDVLKGADSAIEIPELGLTLPAGVLGSRFSSIEGLLTAIQDHVGGTKQHYTGDSSSGGEEAKFRVLKFLKDLEDAIDGTKPITFILDDMTGNSFIEGRANGQHDSSPFDDEKMTIEYYTRTEEQNEHLGLNQMVVENYYKPKTGGDDDSSSDDDSSDSDDEEFEERMRQMQLRAEELEEEKRAFKLLEDAINHD